MSVVIANDTTREPLTLIVGCTDRKSVPVPSELRLRSFDAGPMRVTRWVESVEEAPHRMPLRQLYQGESWALVPRVERASRATRVLVASAGLGLRDAADLCPAYAATFSPRHADSVSGDLGEQHRWWDGLQTAAPPIAFAPGERVLVVLSKRYTEVLTPTLLGLAETHPLFVIGGADAIPAQLRISADAGLRRVLGGTMNGLGMRIAAELLTRYSPADLHTPDARDDWARWVEGVRRVERYDRSPLADEAVRTYIRTLRAGDPTISRSRALRSLRDAGYACEQRRFATLFDDMAAVA